MPTTTIATDISKSAGSEWRHVGADIITILDTDSGILVRERDVMLPCCYGDWWWLGWCRQLFLPPNVIEPLLIILCRKDISATARRGAATRHHNPQVSRPGAHHSKIFLSVAKYLNICDKP